MQVNSEKALENARRLVARHDNSWLKLVTAVQKEELRRKEAALAASAATKQAVAD